MGQIPASFPRLVADAFFAHPVETISRPFSAAFGPRVSKSTFGGTGVSDCTVPGNRLSVLTSPSEAAILQGNITGCSWLNRLALFADPSCGEEHRALGPGMESKGRAIGLREPQRGSLIPPIEGQTGVGHQLVGSEPGRLLPCKDRGGIPPTHYMVCAAGGDTIRCAPYATFGTQELSDNALAALKD